MLLLSLVFSLINLYAVAGSNYQIWCQGTCDSDAKPASTEGGVVLMGGGTDTAEAFIWQISHANGGDFVVLRTSGDDAYNPYIYGLSIASKAKLNSVTTILTKNARASQEPEVLDILRNAEAIFLAGGDQSEYLSYWEGTEIQSIIQEKLSNNVTIGGTSAGCMVLGRWVYSGQITSITSEDALKNPYAPGVTVVPAFLNIPFLDNVITDTHFVTRDRMGRMNTFMARILQDIDRTPPKTVHGVGVDEHTALLLDITTGEARTVGVGTAYICAAAQPPSVCAHHTPLTFTGMSCHRLDAKHRDVFSFASWESKSSVDYTSDIVEGVFQNAPYGPDSVV